MLHDFDQILSAALSLPPGTRAMLADHLLESLDAKSQKRVDAVWAEEAERRMHEIRDGKVQPIDGELVMRELRARRTSGTKVMGEALEQAAEIRHQLEGRRHSDSTELVSEDRQR
jgi:putative addiction module component (TIGR02574 family)